MNLDKLYEITEKEKIKVYDWHIEDANGIYLNYDKINAIALDYDKFGTFIDEKCTLAEELGHYYYDATYSLYSDSNSISKQEYRAKKYSYNILIPLEKLKEAVLDGITEINQLADYFDVTYKFMQKALDYYKSKSLLIFNY
ncbi:MAG: ImmA/IrrE family metallo-endopeptidase [Clostridia bacterium]|nr:ImmA/IrrE family metallo-endopeptidase [Clostridia bacterium]